MKHLNEKAAAPRPGEVRPTLAASYLTPQQACERLGICTATLYRHFGSGRLPYIKLGNRTLIAEDALAGYLASLERTGSPTFRAEAAKC